MSQEEARRKNQEEEDHHNSVVLHTVRQQHIEARPAAETHTGAVANTAALQAHQEAHTHLKHQKGVEQSHFASKGLPGTRTQPNKRKNLIGRLSHKRSSELLNIP